MGHLFQISVPEDARNTRFILATMLALPQKPAFKVLTSIFSIEETKK